MLTLATVAEVAGANLVAELAFFPAGHFLVFLRRGAPVIQGVIKRICFYDRTDVDLFLDTARINDRLAILAFIGWSNWGRSDGAFVVLVVFFLMNMFVLHGIVIAKVTESLRSGRSRHELRIDGKRW